MSGEAKLSGECLFRLWHIGPDGSEHLAWHQRALVIGDLRPGRAVRGEYVVDADGRSADPDAAPACSTCGETPSVDDLTAEHVGTGKRDFLVELRANGCRCAEPRPMFGRCQACGRLAWPPPTNPATCWYCNGPAAPDPPNVCAPCVAHLEREGRKKA